jgi:tRNA A37 threonylcarbamoyladenosine dehydratase
MGAGNRLEPMRFRVTPVSQTHSCPLARRMRKELGARGLGDTPAVWSDELPLKPEAAEDGSHSPGSVAFVPSAAGLLMASWCVRRLLGLV